ncbi:nitrile hydratase subunit beta [Variovorax sp. J31P207]|uniref:nitrile hydratase subunit beta n=1 Tax=Variovorax sp. J31P207 TaxID=3053510 RepID=UPI002574FB66|nr:nitrile hydratase subunit beta [Variovorax sp. J31P207]MDM0071518.1 nitrile hydratase subunit beta [Variovorax sp. J31P207]
MNGAHDVGGKHGFGPVERFGEERVFEHEWERRVAGTNGAVWFGGAWCSDEARAAVERMDPVEYLASSYYEHWVHFMEDLLVRKGVVTAQELAEGRVLTSGKGCDFITKVAPGTAMQLFRTGGSMERDIAAPARFRVGDAVRVTTNNPAHHTRVPSYARGKRGTVISHWGGVAFADTRAQFQGDHPQYLYSVTFEATELWGAQGHPRDRITLEMFESYLDPVEP